MIALKVEEWHMIVEDGIMKELNQEPGDEERGSYHRAEEVGKVGLGEVGTLQGALCESWELSGLS